MFIVDSVDNENDDDDRGVGEDVNNVMCAPFIEAVDGLRCDPWTSIMGCTSSFRCKVDSQLY